MARMLQGNEWSCGRWPRGVYLDEDFGRNPNPPPLLEEVRIVAALVALACVAILLV